MSAPAKARPNSDPYRWYMSLDMVPHAGFLLLAFLGLALLLIFQAVYSWHPALRFAALTLALAILSISVRSRRRRARNGNSARSH